MMTKTAELFDDLTSAPTCDLQVRLALAQTAIRFAQTGKGRGDGMRDAERITAELTRRGVDWRQEGKRN